MAVTILTQVVPIIVVVLLSMIITRVATIALTLTGVSRQSARFQARSALTGAGFTTSESEAIVNHPVRRRIIMWLMLVGNAGIVSVIGVVMITTSRSFGAGAQVNPVMVYSLIILGVASVLFVLSRPRVDRLVSRLIRRGLRRYTDLEVRDYEALLEISGGFAIGEKAVRAGDWVAGRTLAELDLTHEGVLVLGVQRRDGTYFGAPTGSLTVLPGDVLTLYGHDDRLEDLDGRRAGSAGERAHEEARADQLARLQQQQAAADRTLSDDGLL